MKPRTLAELHTMRRTRQLADQRRNRRNQHPILTALECAGAALGIACYLAVIYVVLFLLAV